VASSLLAAIVQSSDDAIISNALDGLITSWNRAAERIFGYPASEMLGKSTSVLGSENASEDPALVLEKIRRGEHVEHYETLRRHKDGSDIIVSLSVSPIRDASGKIIGASKVARDITSTRRAEQALRNADKLALAGRMAASIAHEINNPLEAITNLLYLLQQEPLSEQGSHYLGLAQHELTRVSHITSQTLGFFRGAPGPVRCQISEIADNAISLHAGRIIVSHVTVETSFLAVPPLLCQQGELRQVMVNLISNALDSISGQGRLLLRIRPGSHPVTSARGVRLTVADTGLGMKQNTMRQIFEPFFTTKGSNGTGLGLWVTHQIVERHAGEISVRSSQTPLRHGTVFSIFFPLENPAFTETDTRMTTNPPTAIGGSAKPSGSPAKTTSRADESRRTPFEFGSLSAAYTVV
jgi:PAS domain S-box-containing protein